MSISLNSESFKMSTSSTVCIPLILIGESSKRAIVFMIELLKGQALSAAFMNPDILAVLFYEHMTTEPMVVQKLDGKKTLLVFTENED